MQLRCPFALIPIVLTVGCTSNSVTGPTSASSRVSSASLTAPASTVAAASDESTKIQRGSIIANSDTAGTTSLKGNHDFALDVSLLTGIYPGFTVCNGGPDCVPGASIPLSGLWTGNDVVGIATFKGKRYTDVGSPLSPAFARIAVSGTITAPPQAATATVTGPFTLTGSFASDQPAEPFTGHGTATVSLAWQAFINSWAVIGIRFDID